MTAAPTRPAPNIKALMGSGTRLKSAAAGPSRAIVNPKTETPRDKDVANERMIRDLLFAATNYGRADQTGAEHQSAHRLRHPKVRRNGRRWLHQCNHRPQNSKSQRTQFAR